VSPNISLRESKVSLSRSEHVASKDQPPPYPLAHAPFLPDWRLPHLSAAKDGTRVPSQQPRGCRQPQEAFRGASSGALAGSQGLAARGLPSGTRARRFSSLSALRDPPLTARSTREDHRGTPYSLYRGRRLQRTTLLQHARRRSDRASWSSATQRWLPSRRRPLPRKVLDPNAPSLAATGAG
jgi:hypothetical protein